jgi:hypothetical protein
MGAFAQKSMIDEAAQWLVGWAFEVDPDYGTG